MSFQGLWQCFDGKSGKWSWILVSASEDDNFGLACLQGLGFLLGHCLGICEEWFVDFPPSY